MTKPTLVWQDHILHKPTFNIEKVVIEKNMTVKVRCGSAVGCGCLRCCQRKFSCCDASDPSPTCP